MHPISVIQTFLETPPLNMVICYFFENLLQALLTFPDSFPKFTCSQHSHIPASLLCLVYIVFKLFLKVLSSSPGCDRWNCLQWRRLWCKVMSLLDFAPVWGCWSTHETDGRLDRWLLRVLSVMTFRVWVVSRQRRVLYFLLLPKAKDIVGWLKDVVFCHLIFLKNPSALDPCRWLFFPQGSLVGCVPGLGNGNPHLHHMAT